VQLGGHAPHRLAQERGAFHRGMAPAQVLRHRGIEATTSGRDLAWSVPTIMRGLGPHLAWRQRMAPSE
jgi:hypothetical protein